MMNTIPEKLKRARRAFDGLLSVSVLEDWKYNNLNDQWYIKIQIEIDRANHYISKRTNWYIVVSSAYPFDKVKIYPSIENSITVTFPHQTNNAYIDSSGLWRTGYLCTDVIDRLYEAEPFDVDTRIIFHVKRAILWLEDAVDGKLVLSEDLFELPNFNIGEDLGISVVFTEDVDSYIKWKDTNVIFGTAILARVPNLNRFIYHTVAFSSLSGQEKFKMNHNWGSILTNMSEDIHTAIWIKLSSIPVINIWQPPTTFLELKKVCNDQGIKLLDLLEKIAPQIRDNKRHIFLIGFPIPKYHNGEDKIFFWQALLLPYLSANNINYAGFRPIEKGRWQRDRMLILKDNLQLEWLESENWNEREISLRGQLPISIRNRNISIIGCGSLGATIAEMLIRGGVHKLQVIDNDIVKVGNLTRHILSTSDVGCSKSKAVADRLNIINPHAKVMYITERFYLKNDDDSSVDMREADIILDCTGEDSVLNTLSELNYVKECCIISISIGLAAKRIYIDMQKGMKFKYDKFMSVILKYLQQDKGIAEGIELPRDGTGCWHSTFPARIDDILAAATVSLKAIETYIVSKEQKEISLIFEQDNELGFLTGYKIVEMVKDE